MRKSPIYITLFVLILSILVVYFSTIVPSKVVIRCSRYKKTSIALGLITLSFLMGFGIYFYLMEKHKISKMRQKNEFKDSNLLELGDEEDEYGEFDILPLEQRKRCRNYFCSHIFCSISFYLILILG